MPGRQILIYSLLILIVLLGCSRTEEDVNQDLESSELTLPQIPKISGPYKPTDTDIQIALKNAGFYKGDVDGNIGPLTKKAIRAFQAQNRLAVDGEVGPKTWAVLKEYLVANNNQGLNTNP